MNPKTLNALAILLSMVNAADETVLYSTYTTVIPYETTIYSTYTTVSCPEPTSTSIFTSGDVTSSVVYINTCNPSYSEDSSSTVTVTPTVTGTETQVVTETSTEALIPSSEIVWD